MSQDRWTAVDNYFNAQLLNHDPVLDAALTNAADAGLPAINVAPNQGKFLSLLAQAIGAQRILEIGTLGGYSTIWLARALPPSGKLITLELDPKHAAVARTNLESAGLAAQVDLRVGRALDSLNALGQEGLPPFDLVFIDADKRSNPDYFAWALKLTRPGSVIIVDNVVRGGQVIDESSRDPDIQGVRRLNDLIASEPRVQATALQTVGSKGYDGFTIALVTGS